MGSIDNRISRLERNRLASPEEDPEADLKWAVTVDILNEYSRLRASGAVHYRAGKRIEPENIPRKILGPDYTVGELWSLAIRRVFEREHEIAPNGAILDSDTTEDLIEQWTASMREQLTAQGWDWGEVPNEG